MKNTEKKAKIKNEILEFIILYIQIYGYAPSLKDIAEELHCSLSTVSLYLDTLEDDGKLIIGKDGKRKMPHAISVVGAEYVFADDEKPVKRKINNIIGLPFGTKIYFKSYDSIAFMGKTCMMMEGNVLVIENIQQAILRGKEEAYLVE